MAFTTVRGSNSRPDSFFGTSGVDTITLGVLANGAWLGAQPANDVIAFSSDGNGALNGYTLNGGAGTDTFSALSSTNLNRSQLLGDTGGDIFHLTGLTRSTASGGQGNDQTTTAGLVSSSLINGNQDADQISINAGATSSSVFGGQGDDTLALTTELRSAVVQANEGDDVLTIATGTSLSGSSVNGNQGNDAITVNAIAAFSSSTLFGGDGTDTINAATSTVGILARGDGGNDHLTGGTAADSLTGGTGNDNLTGGADIDSFQVDSGVDAVLDLGTGGDDEIDVASGASANATITAAYTAQENSSNAGTLNATVAAALNTIDPISFSGLIGNGVNLTGNTFNLRLIGSIQSDTITGGSGVETLSGGLGNNQLTGGASGDLFSISGGADIITDVGGTDSILISAGATLFNGLIVTDWIAQNNGFNGNNGGTATLTSNAQGVDISVALSGGTAGWTLRGADVIGNGEVLTGSARADTFEGLAGNDTYTGALGIDTFRVTAGTDEITDANESGNADILIVSAGATANVTVVPGGLNIWTVSNQTANNGTANINVTVPAAGVDLSLATGTQGFTVNAGADGDDLIASAFADTLNGGGTGDRLTGGAQVDQLTGGGGADSFRYTTAATSLGTAGVNTDRITDFVTGTDTIDLQRGGAGALLAGVTISAVTSAAAFAVNVIDATVVATVEDVYTAIAANAQFNVAGNFAASTGAAGGLIGRTISFANGSAAGTYLVINDGTAAFQAANDLVLSVGAGVVAVANTDIATFV